MRSDDRNIFKMVIACSDIVTATMAAAGTTNDKQNKELQIEWEDTYAPRLGADFIYILK